jgi:hypothetical protein
MTALALPLCLLILLAYIVCRVRESARPIRDLDYDELADDEISPLDTRPSRLDDE